jgi:hypothetical protein
MNNKLNLSENPYKPLNNNYIEVPKGKGGSKVREKRI